MNEALLEFADTFVAPFISKVSVLGEEAFKKKSKPREEEFLKEVTKLALLCYWENKVFEGKSKIEKEDSWWVVRDAVNATLEVKITLKNGALFFLGGDN